MNEGVYNYKGGGMRKLLSALLLVFGVGCAAPSGYGLDPNIIEFFDGFDDCCGGNCIITRSTLSELVAGTVSELDAVVSFSSSVFIPRRLQPAVNAHFVGESEDAIASYLAEVDTLNNVWLVNAGSAVMIDTLTPSEIDHPEGKITQWGAGLSARVLNFLRKFLYLRQSGVSQEYAVSDFLSTSDVPLQYLGTISFMDLGQLGLTSLFGLQHIAENSVYYASVDSNYIFGNELDIQFPEQPFLGLPNIGVLWVTNNRIESLPANFVSQLDYLTAFFVNNNVLTGISDQIVSGKVNMGMFSIAGNQLSALPATLFQNTPNPVFFDASYNLLADIPETIFHNTAAMETVVLNNNALTVWPFSTLDNLQSFQLLNVSNNQLSEFDSILPADGSEVILTGNNLTAAQIDALQAAFPNVTVTF